MEQDDKKWTTLESRYIFNRPWLTVRRDRVQLPTGVVNDEYYVIEYPDWINVIAITRDGKMVMERQYRYGLGITAYEIPAGVMEKGETPLEAAKRELMEETGYGNGRWQLLMTASGNPSTTNNMTYCYVAQDVEPMGDRHLDHTEDIDVYLMSPQEVFALLRTDQIKQSLMLAPLWKYFATVAPQYMEQASCRQEAEK